MIRARRRLWPFIFWIALCLGALLLILCAGYRMYEICRDTRAGYGFASPRMARAHRYHGILYSEWRDGEWRFERNGQTCKVFGGGLICADFTS
jgi:hypothetical protein